ncbi:MAG: diaminopimelate epimerase [Leptospiraceae bacterium]|nr:MAG: diaminopimelate epimerase [Leptospiraceae bacterium]
MNSFPDFLDMYSMPFIKMEGIGNDYIYFDFTDRSFESKNINTNVIPIICNRRYGIGSDGIVIIANNKEQDNIKMYMWNSDGSYSKICGNALRCVAYYWYKKKNIKEFYIESGAFLHKATIIEDKGASGVVKIQMGYPIFEKEEIPFYGNKKSQSLYIFYEPEIFPYVGYVVSMGNPHCVFFVDDPDSIEIEVVGSKIENHPLFPERTNVEFIKINPDKTIYQRTWERGSGETLACGSGACASHIVGVLEKALPKKNIIHLKGGDLIIEWEEQIWMTGNATLIYSGNLIKDLGEKLFINS